MAYNRRHFTAGDAAAAAGTQTHLGVRATLQDITQSEGCIDFRDDKMQ